MRSIRLNKTKKLDQLYYSITQPFYYYFTSQDSRQNIFFIFKYYRYVKREFFF